MSEAPRTLHMSVAMVPRNALAIAVEKLAVGAIVRVPNDQTAWRVASLKVTEERIDLYCVEETEQGPESIGLLVVLP